MIVDLGYFCLILGLVLSFYACWATALGAFCESTFSKREQLFLSAKYATRAIVGTVTIAYCALTYAFLTDDFSLDFVAKTASSDLPIFFKFTAVWGGMDGSLLLWALLAAWYTGILSFKYRQIYADVMPHVLLIMNLVLVFLHFMLVGWSNPLARAYPIPTEGLGLNPLLQDLAMIVHPPALYLGFIGMSVPFAFGLGSLLAGRKDNDWILVSRRWTLIAWGFLTIGMLIGGQWAYYELGWGGYWAWDPVENSSLLPWLTATAFLHSAMAQEKRDILKLWNILLVLMTFTLTFIGTFITRSGVLNSVHAFAQSNIGPAFLMFVAIVLIGSFCLLLWRLPLLESKRFQRNLLSKENAFLINNVFFISITFSVFFGTTFPLLADFFADKKLSIQAPFFNAINAPFAMIMLALMGCAPFLAWKKGNLISLKRHLMIPAIVSLAIMVCSYALILPNWGLAVLYGTLYFAFHAVVLEIIKTVRTSKASLLPTETSSTASGFLKNRRKVGAMVIHLGVIAAFLGFSGSFFQVTKDFTIQPNTSVELGEYTLLYRGAETFPDLNTVKHAAVFDLLKDGKKLSTMRPARAFYPTSDEPTTEIAITTDWFNDVYLTLASINEDGSATMAGYVNRFVVFVQASSLFFLVGIFLCFNYRSSRLDYLQRRALASTSSHHVSP